MADGIPTGLSVQGVPSHAPAGAIAPSFTASEGRRFGFPVGAAFFALAALLVWRGRVIIAAIVVILGVCLLLAALVLPARLGPVYRGWMALAGAISKVTTPLFMGVVYFLVFTPVGWMRRIFTGGRASARRADSVWVARDVAARRSDLHRQF